MAEEEPKILDHPIAHDEVSHSDRLVFLIVGVVITVVVFFLMGLIQI
ncbi:MAG: hypothetical protein GF416_03655 [Candidatus Altiarchaeales archaeon]|nr:hypothetical protein [Candidatus Altiarchaeales archaeon]MBD3416215.1 hypothetical protein [Candidatus Altiarchaeales archaeon]